MSVYIENNCFTECIDISPEIECSIYAVNLKLFCNFAFKTLEIVRNEIYLFVSNVI